MLEVPARAGTVYGLHLRPGHPAVVAGGSCAGPDSIGHPTGVAVDTRGDVYVAEATAQRVQVVRPAGPRTAVTVAGTGSAGFDGDGLAGPAGQLDEPTGVAVDGAGDVFIADTANCRVRVVPARGVTLFGQTMEAGRLYTVAGTGVCGTAGQGGPAADAQLWNPVAVAVDGAGDLLVADSGDQSVLLAAVQGGDHYGTTIGAGDLGVVVGGTGELRAVSRRRAVRHRPDGGAQRPPRPRRRPHRCAVRHRRLHARHPGGPGVRRDPSRARHDGG